MDQGRRIGVILAGGKARRFSGQDKGKLVYKNKLLINHVYSRLSLQLDTIVISGKEDYGLDVSVMPDLENGPNGLAAALFSAINHPEVLTGTGFLTAPVDGPMLPHNLYDELFGNSCSAVAVSEGQVHPTFAYWLIADLRDFFRTADLSTSISLRFIAESLKAEHVTFSSPMNFFNINEPRDLQQG